MIPNFHLAVPPSTYCQHIRAKAWGNLYGTGERCLDCGRELTLTHEEPTQQAGVGELKTSSLYMYTRICKHVHTYTQGKRVWIVVVSSLLLSKLV